MLETHTIFDDAASSKELAVHRVTDIKEAIRTQNRVNIFVDNKFYCSLDIAQVVDLHLKIGRELNEADLAELKRASDFGKFYACALQFALLRPHSSREIRDYLNRKTRSQKVRVKNHKTNQYEIREKQGYDKSLCEPVFQRLEQRGYIDDRRFAELWVESRNVKKGSSIKKLRLELQQKGIDSQTIEEVLESADRNDSDELAKIITKKRAKYQDDQKLIQYLLRQGFNYSDISDALSSIESSSV